jgi:ubiquinone/menaquinone biosynthesis C-methylase UbiE
MSMSEPQSSDIQYGKVEYQYQDPKKVSEYDSNRFGRPGGRFLNTVQVETVLDLLGDKPLSVLEAGCGTGRFTYNMARAGHRVTGLDYSPAMLETCAKRGAEEGGAENVELVEGSIFELPFDDNTFDAVLSVHVLMHLPEHDAALLELLRVVKPGGLVIFDIRNRHSLNRISYPFRRAAQRLQGSSRPRGGSSRSSPTVCRRP